MKIVFYCIAFCLLPVLLLGQNQKLTNLEGTTARASNEEINPALAIDGNTSTHWESQGFTKSSTQAWFEIELPQACLVRKININWKVPATNFKLSYTDSLGNWQTVEFARNNNKYANSVVNHFEATFVTNKIQIKMLSRVMMSVFTGGDIFDDEPIGYAIKEIEVLGEIVDDENTIN